jgi:serine phosphatase RsbU (regulator of sigma subunit)
MSDLFDIQGSLSAQKAAVRAVKALKSVRADEMERARQVQIRLLRGQTPRIASLDYAGCSVPALEVGGDFYDFLDLGPGRLGIVLGDVSGKGLPAALLMAALQATLRSYCSMGMTEIPRLLRSVNRLFYEATDTRHFATLFIAQYQEARQSIAYGNCGHNPPFLFHQHGIVERLGATATVLGMFDEWDCFVREIRLGPGDTLVCFSDGITEARDAHGVEFGERRLFDLVANHIDLPTVHLVETIASSVRAFNPGAPHDDATVVAARVLVRPSCGNSSPPHFHRELP